MSRTPNRKRPEELLESIIRYLTKHGLADLSLRPLAKAVGSSPRVLLYYFGSKEKLVTRVLSEIRRRQLAEFGNESKPTFAEACTAAWQKMSASDSEHFFRLFFEAYGIALRNPRHYRSFLHDTIEDWLALIADPLREEGFSQQEARAFATIVLSGLRGFMLDYCNTHDRKRVDRAVKIWADHLDRTLSAIRKAGK